MAAGGGAEHKRKQPGGLTFSVAESVGFSALEISFERGVLRQVVDIVRYPIERIGPLRRSGIQ
jgi:hypothetical protein